MVLSRLLRCVVERTAGLLSCCPVREVAERALVFFCEEVVRTAPDSRPFAEADLDVLEAFADR